MIRNYGVNQGRIGHIALKKHVKLTVSEFWISGLNPVESDDFRELSWAQKSKQGWCVFENRSVFLHTAIFRWRFFTHKSSTLFPKFIISAQFQHSFSLFPTESTFFLSFCVQKVPFETNFSWKPITFFVRSGNEIYFFTSFLKFDDKYLLKIELKLWKNVKIGHKL